MALLVCGGWIIAWSVAGPDLSARKSLAITTSMRHVGLALLLCAPLPPENGIIAAIIAFGGIALIMNFLLGLVLHWIKNPRIGHVAPRPA